MRYEFHPEALEEYRQAALWYGEREPEVGLKFAASVEDAIARIVEAPTRWRLIDEDVVVASHAFFLSVFSTQSKTTSYSSWQSCTSAASLSIGNHESRRVRLPTQWIRHLIA